MIMENQAAARSDAARRRDPRTRRDFTPTKRSGSRAAAAIVACTLFVAGSLSMGSAIAADKVTAKAENATAAARDVNTEKNTATKGYDLDKARRIKASQFASDMHQDCVKYVDRVHTMQFDRRRGEPSDSDQPSIFSDLYQSPDTRSMLGDQVYNVLNSQQERLKEVSSQIINMRRIHRTAEAREMMAKMGHSAATPGASGPEPTESGFETAWKELENLTVAHCEYLKSLI